MLIGWVVFGHVSMAAVFVPGGAVCILLGLCTT